MNRSLSAFALAVSCASLLLAAPSAAQQPATVQQPRAAEPPPARQPAQLNNVRIEVTITDDRETGTPPKVVALVVADRENGRVRSGVADLMLNLDARPEIVREGRVRVHLSLEYRPARGETDRGTLSALTESLAVILDDGKPLVVSQAPDPTSARTVKVEVKATVLAGR